jgi:hypothetical protein
MCRSSSNASKIASAICSPPLVDVMCITKKKRRQAVSLHSHFFKAGNVFAITHYNCYYASLIEGQ